MMFLRDEMYRGDMDESYYEYCYNAPFAYTAELIDLWMFGA